jgi:CheY-like chemotaxis protein
LFRPFSQADASTTRKYGGTGLGLHLSKQLAEKLGGSLSVQSMLDIGSCFTVTVSTGSLSEADILSTWPDFEQIDIVQRGVPKQLRFVGRILLTEDNSDNQRLMSILLKRMGIEYSIANNGKEAMAMVEAEDFDVILMDVQMPVMDGLTATRLLRKNAYTGPIVALTANAMKQEQQECFDAGCNDVCTKPIDQVALGRVFSKYLVAALPNNVAGPPIVSSLLASEPDLADLIREFVKKLPEMINNIKLAYAQGDLEGLRHEVHTLKGTGGNFGYAEVFELAKRIEFEIVAGNHYGAGELIEALEAIIVRVEQGLLNPSEDSAETHQSSVKR